MLFLLLTISFQHRRELQSLFIPVTTASVLLSACAASSLKKLRQLPVNDISTNPGVPALSIASAYSSGVLSGMIFIILLFTLPAFMYIPHISLQAEKSIMQAERQ